MTVYLHIAAVGVDCTSAVAFVLPAVELAGSSFPHHPFRMMHSAPDCHRIDRRDPVYRRAMHTIARRRHMVAFAAAAAVDSRDWAGSSGSRSFLRRTAGDSQERLDFRTDSRSFVNVSLFETCQRGNCKREMFLFKYGIDDNAD